MHGHPNSGKILLLRTRFSEAPLALRAFAIFSSFIIVLQFSLLFFGSKNVQDSLVPITGWNPSFGYMFGLYFTFALIFMRLPRRDTRPLFLTGVWQPWIWRYINWLRLRRATRPYSFLRSGFILPLVLQMLFGAWTAMTYDGIDYGNPYLRVNPWQTLWTVGLPALWILVLYSPQMNRFCHRAAEPSDGLDGPI
jgi:hypothetical protein